MYAPGMGPPVGIQTPTGGCPLSSRVPKISLCTSDEKSVWSFAMQVHTSCHSRVYTKILNQVDIARQCHWHGEHVN